MRVALLAGILACLATAVGASATGGASIANAPMIQSGATMTLNTSTDQTSRIQVGSPTSRGCWIDHEYFRLALAAGDKVEINNGPASFQYLAVGIFPPGTTDKTITKVDDVAYGLPGRKPLKYTAKKTGTYPVVVGPNCYDGNDDGFSFVVKVTHK